jgi:urea carboxylase
MNKTIFPVRLTKATGGGGGIGIYICNSHDEVVSQFAVAARQGQASFGDSGGQ